MKITTIGIDLAKSVFQVHGVDEHGKAVLKKQVKRAQVMAYFANLGPALIGMEACASAHYWARKLGELGHTVKLMAPQYVRPYVKTNKNDAADAEAICEAVGRPNMVFVPVKSAAQQSVLALHRARQGLVKARTAQGNQIRGLLGEFGIVMGPGLGTIEAQVPPIMADEGNELPGSFRQLLERLLGHLRYLSSEIAGLEAQIKAWHRESEASQRLAAIPGIGVLGASALVAGMGSNVRSFANGRQLSACIGLVPRQHSTGGKPRLLGISKRGDQYLRTLLIHGARAVLQQVARHPQRAAPWLRQLLERRPFNVAVVALANKNARTAWALLAHERKYQPDYKASAASGSA